MDGGVLASHYEPLTKGMEEGIGTLSTPPSHHDIRLKRQERTHGNVKILVRMCVLFALFVTAEVIGSLASNSLSLLGDAAAMSVDVFTYFCNLFAEWMKSDDARLTWRNRLILEVLIPAFSVIMLLAVTIYVTQEAIHVLINDSDKHDTVNIWYLYGFASGNLVVDIISSYLFCVNGGSDVFVAYHHHPTFIADESALVKSEQDLISNSKRTETPLTGWLVPPKEDDAAFKSAPATATDQQHQQQHQHTKPNLNMVSAFTHLGGDTVRTLSVFIAAVVSTCARIPSQTCDAWAAIVVTFTIMLLAFPLVREIVLAYLRLAQERRGN